MLSTALAKQMKVIRCCANDSFLTRASSPFYSLPNRVHLSYSIRFPLDYPIVRSCHVSKVSSYTDYANCTNYANYSRDARTSISNTVKFPINMIELENKWRTYFEHAPDKSKVTVENLSRPKFYALAMFPYPSGSLHMGHVRVYTIPDCIARHRKMLGYQVLQPMGWDAFGLPAENAARERNIDPKTWTFANIAQMKRQLQACALDIDWSRELYTCSPYYYQWTQWIFLQMYKAGLAYQAEALVNWDPVDQTVLADEQVDSAGKSWRSGAVVERKRLKQWYLAITNYAQKLTQDLDNLKWPQSVKDMQTNWIGIRNGVMIKFKVASDEVSNVDNFIEAFTTRPEFLDGVTFLAVHPDHPLATLSSTPTNGNCCSDKLDDVYDGWDTGRRVVNPLNQRSIPIFVANYVKEDCGTGIVMGIPAHFKDDWNFAQKYGIDVRIVFQGGQKIEQALPIIISEQTCPPDKPWIDRERAKIVKQATQEGWAYEKTMYRFRDWLISRQRYWGTPIPIIHCEKCGVVPVPEEQLPVVLPDIHDNTIFSSRNIGGSILNSKEMSEWRCVACPRCGGNDAKRETDTMDTFMDSSWYYLRYLLPTIDQESKLSTHSNQSADFKMMAGDPNHLQRWLPVDVYVGGIEHAILHLLYARFVCKFLADRQRLYWNSEPAAAAAIPNEPFIRLITQGLVEGLSYKCPNTGRYLRPDELMVEKDQETEQSIVLMKEGKLRPICEWEKMSKSKYNGVDPQKIIETYGIDTVRLYILFKAPPEVTLYWSEAEIVGPHRWLQRLYQLAQTISKFNLLSHEPIDWNSLTKAEDRLARAYNEALDKVNHAFDLSNCSLNTAVAALMKLSNVMEEAIAGKTATTVKPYSECEEAERVVSIPLLKRTLIGLAQMLYPMAPYMATEVYSILEPFDISTWPEVFFNSWPEQLPVSVVLRTIIVQINGKTIGTIECPLSATQTDVERVSQARFLDRIPLHPSKVIFRKDKVINFIQKVRKEQ